MKANSFAIEHERTRHSLQNAFEGLFSKYGREFGSDDEIDIMDLRVVKKGRTLESMRPLEFGTAFHKKRRKHKRDKKRRKHRKNRHREVEHLSKRKLEKPKKHNVVVNQGSDDMEHSIWESIRGINHRIVEAWPERDFETFFRHLQSNQRDEFMGKVGCQCQLRNCSDCIFTSIMLPEINKL